MQMQDAKWNLNYGREDTGKSKYQDKAYLLFYIHFPDCISPLALRYPWSG